MKKINLDPDVLSLRKIFNKADLQGIFFGDNLDEYDPEIKPILKILPNCDSADKVRKALWAVFKEKFGTDIAGHEHDYEDLAQSLFAWKAKNIR